MLPRKKRKTQEKPCWEMGKKCKNELLRKSVQRAGRGSLKGRRPRFRAASAEGPRGACPALPSFRPCPGGFARGPAPAALPPAPRPVALASLGPFCGTPAPLSAPEGRAAPCPRVVRPAPRGFGFRALAKARARNRAAFGRPCLGLVGAGGLRVARLRQPPGVCGPAGPLGPPCSPSPAL